MSLVFIHCYVHRDTEELSELDESAVTRSVLEVHQFSRDAGVAEAWLLGQDPYLSSREIGQSVDEVEKLIKRHEAFEKSAATWEERFAALERLTTVRHFHSFS